VDDRLMKGCCQPAGAPRARSVHAAPAIHPCRSRAGRFWLLPVVTARAVDVVVAGGPLSSIGILAVVSVALLIQVYPMHVLFTRLYMALDGRRAPGSRAPATTTSGEGDLQESWITLAGGRDLTRRSASHRVTRMVTGLLAVSPAALMNTTTAV
jgi:hypothetical protein